MDRLEEFFFIEISHDQMSAHMHCKDKGFQEKMEVDKVALQTFFVANHIVYGVMQQAVDRLCSSLSEIEFPIQIAKGLAAIDGEDSRVEFELNLDTRLDRTANWDFREVMRIPNVVKGQKLATIIPPTSGINGKNVSGKEILARPGKSISIKAGQNVVFREEDSSFYAAASGQISTSGRYIHVYPIFEVRESLSMKTGNLDFAGTIIIHGDVPSGFQVKAKGDIKIHGMVEAATIQAGGSVYVSEGLAGQKTGFIQAGENVTISYINQGIVYAENDLYVENSILHSECMAFGHVFCQKGSMIGGTLSAGKTVEVNDIGNRLGAKSEIIFGYNKKLADREDMLKSKKVELKDTLHKLALLESRLSQQANSNDPSLRISILRHRNFVQKTNQQLDEIEDMLSSINSRIGSETKAALIVRNFIYPNTTVAFGKYKRIIKDSYHFVKINLEKNEIVVEPLF